MGLDTVELVMEVEQSFGIKIDDRDASLIVTVGDLYRYVLDRLGGEDRTACLSCVTFHRLRQGLTTVLGLERSLVRPSADLNDLLPWKTRPADWQRLRSSLDLRFPDLCRPSWAVWTIALAWLAAFGSAVVGFLFMHAWPAITLFLGIVAAWAAVFAVVVSIVTRPLIRCMPDGVATVRELVGSLMSLNFERLRATGRGWNRDEVWEVLRGLIVTHLGVRPEEVTPGATFVGDLGAG